MSLWRWGISYCISSKSFWIYVSTDIYSGEGEHPYLKVGQLFDHSWFLENIVLLFSIFPSLPSSIKKYFQKSSYPGTKHLLKTVWSSCQHGKQNTVEITCAQHWPLAYQAPVCSCWTTNSAKAQEESSGESTWPWASLCLNSCCQMCFPEASQSCP